MPSEMVEVPRAGGQPMQSFLATPDGPGPHPGVVVVHELFGLNENIREVCGRFAGEGYVALGVDLFSRVSRPVCLARIFAGMLLTPLRNGVLTELRGVLDWLQERPEVDPGRIGAIGFCMGGAYALQLACVDGDLRAASVFYGSNPRPLQAVARACPIVGSYPEQDWTAGAGRKLDAALAHFDVPHDVKIYPSAHHSFFNDHGAAYNAPAASDAWQRTLVFFRTHL